MELYLDANAHLPMLPEAIDAFVTFNSSKAGSGNAKSPSPIGAESMSAIEKARGQIAESIGAEKSSQIIFTNSATQACQWALTIIEKTIGTANVAVSPIEHPAVGRPATKMFPDHQKLLVSNEGQVLESRDRHQVRICIHTQNEIGTIQPIEKLGKYCFLMSDMTQSAGKMELDVKNMNVDLATFGAHKFGGPSGVGFLYIKDTSQWREFGTGSRYFMDITGTPNSGGIVATASALMASRNSLERRRAKMVSFQNCVEEGLQELGFQIVGLGVERTPSTTFAKVPSNMNSLELMMDLGEKGIYVGLGSACGALYTGGSPLMQALGRPSDGQEYMRLSQWGDYDEKDAKKFLDTLTKIITGD